MLCDIILLNFLKGAEQYKAKKFEEVKYQVLMIISQCNVHHKKIKNNLINAVMRFAPRHEPIKFDNQSHSAVTYEEAFKLFTIYANYNQNPFEREAIIQRQTSTEYKEVLHLSFFSALVVMVRAGLTQKLDPRADTYTKVFE